MGALVHTCLGSSYLIAHVLHCPPPPPAHSFIKGNNDKENKEPAPHTEPPPTWVMCQGTCTVEFGWSVASQAFYRTQNRPPPRFCLFCADERNKRKQAKAERYVRKRARANDT